LITTNKPCASIKTLGDKIRIPKNVCKHALQLDLTTSMPLEVTDKLMTETTTIWVSKKTAEVLERLKENLA